MPIPPLPAAFTRFAVGQSSVRIGEAMLVAAIVAFAIRAYYGSHLLEFGDESEKFVAVSLMLRGDRLYRDIVATHGPLAYLLAWATSIIFGTTDFVYARLSNVVLALLATAAIATSPLVVRNRVASCWASALFLAPLSALWIMQTLHMVIYHAHIAFLTTIILAQLVLPAVAGLRITRAGAAAAGAACVAGLAAAYSFAAPAAIGALAVALAIVSTQGTRALSRVLAFAAIGAATAALPLAIWISIFADWRAMAIYHFYINQVVYVAGAGFDPWAAFKAIAIDMRPERLVQSFGVVTATIGLALIWHRAPATAIRLAALTLTGLAIIALNPRGSPYFHNAPFVIAAISTLSLALACRIGAAKGPRRLAYTSVAILALGAAEATARLGLISPHWIPRSQAFAASFQYAPGLPIVRLVQTLAASDEPILVLPFAPALYYYTARQPASGYYYYLPLHSWYDEKPFPGHKMDLCADIAAKAPPIILIYGDRIGPWLFADYAACVVNALAQNYVQHPSEPVAWIRRDRLERIGMR